MLDNVLRAGRRLLGLDDTPATVPPETRADSPAEPVAPVHPRVLMIVHNPPVAEAGGRRLTEIFGWNDPDALARQYIEDLRACSYGYLNYQIVERIDADWHPPKVDGFRYTNASFMQAWQSRRLHEPNAVDYPAQVRAFDLISRYEAGDFDEVWFFAHPFNGDYESTMVGRGAFWCNSPPVAHTAHCNGRFVIMAFNYERGVDCMLENFGHRAESVMSRVYERLGRGRNMWELFTRYDKIAPGQAQCGNVHFAPSSAQDYDWGNARTVPSCCDDWYSYPHLPGHARPVDRRAWGGGEMRAHHLWWFKHFPHVAGATDGVSNNWWEYIVQVERVP